MKARFGVEEIIMEVLKNRTKILYWIIRSLDNSNFIETGLNEYGKPYAITDSEVAADSLSETLYNLGFVEKNNDNLDGDYYRTQSFSDGFWEMKFVAM